MPPEGRNQQGIFSIIVKTENVKVTQLKKTGNATATPLRETESVHSVPPYDIKSH